MQAGHDAAAAPPPTHRSAGRGATLRSGLHIGTAKTSDGEQTAQHSHRAPSAARCARTEDGVGDGVPDCVEVCVEVEDGEGVPVMVPLLV